MGLEKAVINNLRNNKIINRKINVGVIGYGTVGKGAVNVLIDNRETIKRTK